jgi:hypothetical protein
MKARFICFGMLIAVAALLCGCGKGSAPGQVVGGYAGWRDQSTGGADGKLTGEVSIKSSNPLFNGLWLNYVNYNNNNNGQNVKSISTYVDHSAPFGLVTADGALMQHFPTHVGKLVAQSFDTNGDGIICWIGCTLEAGSPGGGDYTLSDAFCPAVGGTATSGNKGFKANCDIGVWIGIGQTTMSEETVSALSNNSNQWGIPPSGFTITLNDAQTLAKVIQSSPAIPNSGGIAPSISAVSLPSGASHTLASPITVSVYGLGSAIAVDADQPGLKELASWLASQWAGQPDGETSITVTFNNGAASASYGRLASGQTAANALNAYASW